MLQWLAIFLARYSLGERWRKSTSADYRYYFGVFFIFGGFTISVLTILRPLLDHASSLKLWVYGTAGVSMMCFICILWGRYIPASVSLILGIVTWAIIVWMGVTDRVL